MAERKPKTTSKSRPASKQSSTRSTKTKEEKEAVKLQEQERLEKLRKDKRLKDEIWAIVLIGIGIFLFISLFTATTGAVGEFIKNLLFGLFGEWVAKIMTFYFIIIGVLIFANIASFLTARSVISTIVMFMLLSTMFSNRLAMEPSWRREIFREFFGKGNNGGLVGDLLAYIFGISVGRTGLWIICIVGIIICLLFIINTPISTFFDNLKMKRKLAKEQKAIKAADLEKANELAEKEHQVTIDEAKASAKTEAKIETSQDLMKMDKETLFKKAGGLDKVVPAATEKEDTKPEATLDISSLKNFDNANVNVEDLNTPIEEAEPEVISDFEGQGYTDSQKQILDYVNDDNLFGKDKKAGTGYGLNGEGQKKTLTAEELDAQARMPKADEEAKPKPAKKNIGYKFPSLDLLKKNSSAGKNSGGSELNDMAILLNDTLRSFGVDATVVDVVKGPAVTRFEVKPAPGVKVSSITRLKDDIALCLSAKSIRIEAPIPGMSAVGIEISNTDVSMVGLREVLESSDFKTAKSKISVGLGKSIDGKNVIMDIKKMPHMLIAGTTGSGKSVCINTILLSLLFKATPDEVKLILIDPKVVELSEYNGIPHMMVPVVTEPAKAASALAWAVAEMNDRYNKFAEESVRDLESYNEAVKANLENEKVLPQIVIIIDELADLIIASKNQVEDQISRLCAKARAAGMHLIIATQTPRSDVITGVIKANLPSKIALAVSTALDSRIILDESGAESLLGKGDMLYAPQDRAKPLRVQGCFVSDAEVKNVLDFIKANSEAPTYSATVSEALDRAQTGSTNASEDSENDDMLYDCITAVIESGSCSVSMLQRRFRLGYNRAARIVDVMEERGIVGPPDGMRPRKVLMTMEEFENRNGPDVEDEID